MSGPLFLLDTSILLHLVRGKALAQHIEKTYRLQSSGVRPFVSRVTHGEIRSIAKRNRWGVNKVATLEAALTNVVTVELQHPSVVDSYVAIELHSQGLGRTLGQNDLWIAACSKAAGATLLTTDKDFDHLDPDHLSVEWVPPELGRGSP